MKAALKLVDVSLTFSGARTLFRGLHLTISGTEGTVVGLAGPSGSGKTTLLRLLLGLQRPDEGSIRVPEELLFGYVPQQPVLLPQLSASDNARLLSLVGRHTLRFSTHRFQRLVEALNLEDVVSGSTRVDKLSGGERQRLSLLRALSVAPDVLLLDEPCSGLDSLVKQEFLAVLSDSLREVGATAVYVTHHIEELTGLAESILFLDARRLDGQSRVYERSTRDFLSSPPCLGAAVMVNYPFGQKISLQGLAALRVGLPQLPVTEGWSVLRPENINIAAEGAPAIVLGRQGSYVRAELRETAERLTLAPNSGLSAGDELVLRVTAATPCYDLSEEFLGYSDDLKIT